MTKEQKLALKDERIRIKEQKEEREKKLKQKEQLKELGKPKRPTSAFFLFYAEEAGKAKTNTLAAKQKFETLNESQKNVYKQKAAAELTQYR